MKELEPYVDKALDSSASAVLGLFATNYCLSHFSLRGSIKKNSAKESFEKLGIYNPIWSKHINMVYEHKEQYIIK